MTDCQNLLIRRALPNAADAELLRDAERDTLGDSDYTLREVIDVVRSPEHVAYLAREAGEVAGFCSCFRTCLAGDEMCLEVDMLGVRLAYRRRGIASGLIYRALADARKQGVSLARSVVAEDNTGSQRAFERAGLARTEPLRMMMVHELDGLEPTVSLVKGHVVTGGGTVRRGAQSAVRGEEHRLTFGQHVAEGTCLCARTLAYRGLWIERLVGESPEMIERMGAALAYHARRRGLDEVGYLVPTDDPETMAALGRAGYREIGAYFVYRDRESSAAANR